MSTADEILLQIAETQRRLQPMRDAIERELILPLIHRAYVSYWWRMRQMPTHPQLLLTYERN